MITPHAACLVRRWVQLYTHGLPIPIRDRRREEIAADLWSQAEESRLAGRGDGATALDMIVRLLVGLPADISWRLQKQGQREAVSAAPRMVPGNPATGAVAILGGLMLGTALLVIAIMGPSRPWSDPVAGWIIVISTTVGMLALALASLGLMVLNEGRLRRIGLIGGVVAVTAGFLGAVGAYQAVGFLAAGSAMLAWALGRIGALDRRLVLSHVITGTAFFAAVLVTLAGANLPGLGLILAWYPATWIAIGYALLHGRSAGEPAPQT